MLGGIGTNGYNVFSDIYAGILASHVDDWPRMSHVPAAIGCRIILGVSTDFLSVPRYFVQYPLVYCLLVMATDTIQFVVYGVKVWAQPSLPTSAAPSIRFGSDADSTIYWRQVLIIPYQLTPCIVQNSLKYLWINKYHDIVSVIPCHPVKVSNKQCHIILCLGTKLRFVANCHNDRRWRQCCAVVWYCPQLSFNPIEWIMCLHISVFIYL